MNLREHLRVVIDFLTDAVPFYNIPKADGIFLFGCRDARVAIQGAKLYAAGMSPIIIVSGKGDPEKLPNHFTTEAEYFAYILAEHGVPSSSIIAEHQATNTLENVLFGMRAAEKIALQISSLILCAKPPLLRRSRATFQKQFPYIATYGSAYLLAEEEWPTTDKHPQRRILAEIDRLLIYATKRDIAPITIPQEVMHSYYEACNILKESAEDSFI